MRSFLETRSVGCTSDRMDACDLEKIIPALSITSEAREVHNWLIHPVCLTATSPLVNLFQLKRICGGLLVLIPGRKPPSKGVADFPDYRQLPPVPFQVQPLLKR